MAYWGVVVSLLRIKRAGPSVYARHALVCRDLIKLCPLSSKTINASSSTMNYDREVYILMDCIEDMKKEGSVPPFPSTKDADPH